MNAEGEKILVRGVNWLGDAVMSTPALIRLREARPRARIAILTHQKLADLWDGQSFVDEVLTFSSGAGVWRVAGQLRAKKFDIGIALPNSFRSALELFLARIPRRIGFGGRFRGVVLTDSLPPPPGSFSMRKRNPAEIRQLVARNAPPEFVPTSAHHIRRYLHITAALGASAELLPPRLTVAGAEVETARSKFGLTEQHFWIGLAPGAEYGPAKRWPAERFAETARAFREKTRCRPVLFGGPGDRDVAQAVEAAIGQPVLNLAGKTSLRELAAALKTCKVVLSNDSGPMHLAAALGVPVVALFGSTSPELTAPPGVRVLRQAPPCAPCFLRQCPIDLRCLRDIEVSAVVKEVSQQCIGTGRAGDSTAA